MINKIGRPRNGSPICLIEIMMRDRIWRYEILLSCIINIILSEDLTKDKKLLSSNNYPFYDSGQNFGYWDLRCRCYWDLSCRCYSDHIEVWLVHLKCRFNCDSFTWLLDYNYRFSDYKLIMTDYMIANQ